MFVKEHLLAFILILILFVLFSTGTVVSAKQQDSNETKDFFEMSLEELMEVPVVISASRRKQKITETSVPTTIITAEDIHYSGLTNIPEILQFAPGIDMVQADRNRYAVGIRGLHDFTSDRTLVLINSRSVYSVTYGGAEWYRLPVLIEDIERIEIVRGPGGAAWGANAFNGVINIITKKPEDVLGCFSSTTINEFGESSTHFRWAQKEGKWSWRSSLGYLNHGSSDDVGAGDFESATPALNSLMGFSTFEAQDSSQNWITDTEVVYQSSDATKISFGIGHSNNKMGNYEMIGFFPQDNQRFENTRIFSKIDHNFADGSSGYLQCFSNIGRSGWGGHGGYNEYETDFEAQLNLAPTKKHKISIGGNARFIHINQRGQPSPTFVFDGEPFDEQFLGLFAIDRFQATERLTIEAQIRGDWYSETQADWAGRITGLYSLDEQRNHILRLSAAKAFRTPTALLRQVTSSRFPIAPGIFQVNLTKPRQTLRNEEIMSFEAGYNGQLAKGVSLRLDSYYQQLEHMLGKPSYADPLGLGRTFASFENTGGGRAWGTECELTIENKKGKLSAWYAYNGFRPENGNQDIRAYSPAVHKMGFTGRLFLSDGFVFNANYKFTNTTPSNDYHDIGSSNRLDLTISKTFAKGNGEVMFGVSNVLVRRMEPVYSLGTYSAHTTPGRMFFMRLQVKF